MVSLSAPVLELIKIITFYMFITTWNQLNQRSAILAFGCLFNLIYFLIHANKKIHINNAKYAMFFSFFKSKHLKENSIPVNGIVTQMKPTFCT